MFIDDESNDESEVEFDLEEDPTGVEENTINDETLAGEALRNYRQTIKENENLVQATKSSQATQSSQKSSQSSGSEQTQPTNTQKLSNLQISEGRVFENRRLRHLNMIRSRSQRNTPAVGNCFIEALADQTRYFTFYKLYSL